MRGGTRSIPWPIVGLVALSAVAAVLVALALRGQEPPSPTIVLSTEEESPTAPEDDEPSDEEAEQPALPDTSTLQATPEEMPAVPADRGLKERPLSVLTAGSAMRATQVLCPGPAAQVEVTTDGARTWTSAANPSEAVVRLSWVAADNAFVVGAAEPQCAPGFWRSADSARSWDGPVPPNNVWHLLADPTATELHAPGGIVDSPCGEQGNFELEPQPSGPTFVLCGDGRVFRTDDDAATWTASGREDAAVAMGLLDRSPVLAVAGRSDCPGIAVERTDGSRLGCIEGADAGGGVALGFSADSYGLFIGGEQTWVTDDGGATWSRPG